MIMRGGPGMNKFPGATDAADKANDLTRNPSQTPEAPPSTDGYLNQHDFDIHELSTTQSS